MVTKVLTKKNTRIEIDWRETCTRISKIVGKVLAGLVFSNRETNRAGRLDRGIFSFELLREHTKKRRYVTRKKKEENSFT